MNIQRVSPAVHDLRRPQTSPSRTPAPDVYTRAGSGSPPQTPPTPELEEPRAPRYCAPRPMSRAWFIAAVTVEVVGAVACIAATCVTPLAIFGADACLVALGATVAAWNRQSGVREMLRLDDPNNPVLKRALSDLPRLRRAAAAREVFALTQRYPFASPVEAMRVLLPLNASQRTHVCWIAYVSRSLTGESIRQDDLEILTQVDTRGLCRFYRWMNLASSWLHNRHGTALVNRVRWLNEDPPRCDIHGRRQTPALVLRAFESKPDAPSLHALQRIWESLQNSGTSMEERGRIAAILAESPRHEHAQILQALIGEHGPWLLTLPESEQLPTIYALTRAPGPHYPEGPWNLLQHVPVARRFDAMRAVSLTIPSARPSLLEILAQASDPGPLIDDVLHTASTQCLDPEGPETQAFLHGMLHDAPDDDAYAAMLEAIQTLGEGCRRERAPNTYLYSNLYRYSPRPNLRTRLQQSSLGKLVTLAPTARLETLRAVNTVSGHLSVDQAVTVLDMDLLEDRAEDAVRIRALARYVAELEIREPAAQELLRMLTAGPEDLTAKLARGMQQLVPLVQRWSDNERNAAIAGLSANRQTLGSIADLRPRRNFLQTNGRYCAFVEGLIWAASSNPAAAIPEVNADNPWDLDSQRSACIAALAGQPLCNIEHPLMPWAARTAGHENLRDELASQTVAAHALPYLKGTPSVREARAAVTAWGGHGPLPGYMRTQLLERLAPEMDEAPNAETLHNAFAYCNSLALPQHLDGAFRVALLDALYGVDRILSKTVRESFECIGCTDEAPEHVQLAHCAGNEKLCNACVVQSIHTRPELTTCHTHGATCQEVALTGDYMHRVGVPQDIATQQRIRHYRGVLRRVPEFNLDLSSATLHGTQAEPVRVGPDEIPPVPKNLTRLQRTHLRLLLSGLGAWPIQAGNGVHRECYQCGTGVQKGDACLHMTCTTGTRHDWDFEQGVFTGTRFGTQGISAQSYIPLGQGQLARHRFYEALPRGRMNAITTAQVQRRRNAWLNALGGVVRPQDALALNSDGTLIE